MEQFSKLKSYVGTEIRLFIPEQVKNEVIRNRDNKIKDALTKFDKFDFTIPVFCKSYSEHETFSKKLNELKQLHKEWNKKVHSDIESNSLAADRVIAELFETAGIIACTPEIVKSAEMRYKSGNPPGKDNKLGDAINWECLLASVPNGEDIYFITSDKDYLSVINDEKFNSFLKQEWKSKKNAEVIFFKRLVPFLNTHANEIKLQTEQTKDDLIRSLRESGNFATTHSIIKSLSQYSNWTANQVEDLCVVAIENSQVAWILKDTDVEEFYRNLLSGTQYTSDNTKSVQEELDDTDESEEEILNRLFPIE